MQTFICPSNFANRLPWLDQAYGYSLVLVRLPSTPEALATGTGQRR